MYKPSKELCEILLCNGFKNISYHYTQTHYIFYIGPLKLYNPKLHRLAFALGKGRSKFVIFFEFNDIEIVFGGRNTVIRQADLNEDQLRSIIAFFKMPYNRRYSILDATNCQIELGWETYEKYKNYGFPFDKKFETEFNKCKTNISNKAS